MFAKKILRLLISKFKISKNKIQDNSSIQRKRVDMLILISTIAILQKNTF